MSETSKDIIRDVVEAVRLVLIQRGDSAPDVDADSAMGSPVSWDSLAFVEIFVSVSQHFGLDVSDDDAIHFMSIREIAEFVGSRR
jgi:acyl carrier protein